MDIAGQMKLAKHWNKLLAPYSRANNRKAGFQLASTAILFAINWGLMLWSLSISYWLTLALALPAAGLQIRLFIFQHDCGHGSFTSSSRANNIIGRIVGVLMMTPYSYWKRTHAIHHASSGDLDRRSFGDVETLTVDEYLAAGFWKRLGYRLYRNPIILFVLGPVFQFVLKHRLPFTPKGWKREKASVFWTNVSLAGIVVLAYFTIGIGNLLLVQLPITLISGSIGMWLFYVQHQFEDTYWRNTPDWSFHKAGLEGSSLYDLPIVLHWFTGNIGFHHIHHLASKIPNYHLKACFDNIPEVRQVTRLSIAESFRCARLHLWDETEKRLVSYRHLRTIKSAA